MLGWAVTCRDFPRNLHVLHHVPLLTLLTSVFLLSAESLRSVLYY
jgi:hypothetical protein